MKINKKINFGILGSLGAIAGAAAGLAGRGGGRQIPYPLLSDKTPATAPLTTPEVQPDIREYVTATNNPVTPELVYTPIVNDYPVTSDSGVIMLTPLQFEIPSGVALTPAQYEQLAVARSNATGSVWENAGFGYIYYPPPPGKSETPYLKNALIPGSPESWPDAVQYADLYNAANRAGRDAQYDLLKIWGVRL